MTGYQAVYGALRVLKIVRFPQQTPSPDQLADGLTFLNNMLDSWSTQRILIPYTSLTTYALTAATAAYPIGPTAASPFNVPRPIRIDAAGIVQAASGVYYRTPLKIVSQKEYAEILDKTTTADIPEILYYSPSFGNGTVTVWPIPNVSTSTLLELSAWAALPAFPDSVSPGTDVPIAPGYARAIIYNLAVEMEPSMEGATLDAADAKTAAESKQYIMELNSEMVPQVPDGAIPPLTSAPFEPVPATLKAVAQAKFGGGAPAGTGQ